MTKQEILTIIDNHSPDEAARMIEEIMNKKDEQIKCHHQFGWVKGETNKQGTPKVKCQLCGYVTYSM